MSGHQEISISDVLAMLILQYGEDGVAHIDMEVYSKYEGTESKSLKLEYVQVTDKVMVSFSDDEV